MAVHHIHVDAIGPGLLSLSHLLTEPGKVGSEDRRSQLHCACGHFRVFLFYFHEWHTISQTASPREYCSISTLTGLALQISSQYSRIARSEENLPVRAILRIDIRVQLSPS